MEPSRGAPGGTDAGIQFCKTALTHTATSGRGKGTPTGGRRRTACQPAPPVRGRAHRRGDTRGNRLLARSPGQTHGGPSTVGSLQYPGAQNQRGETPPPERTPRKPAALGVKGGDAASTSPQTRATGGPVTHPTPSERPPSPRRDPSSGGSSPAGVPPQAPPASAGPPPPRSPQPGRGGLPGAAPPAAGAPAAPRLADRPWGSRPGRAGSGAGRRAGRRGGAGGGAAAARRAGRYGAAAAWRGAARRPPHRMMKSRPG